MHRTERVGNGPDVQNGITLEPFPISVDGYRSGGASGWLPTSADEAPGLRVHVAPARPEPSPAFIFDVERSITAQGHRRQWAAKQSIEPLDRAPSAAGYLS